MKTPLKKLRIYATLVLNKWSPSTLCMARSNLIRRYVSYICLKSYPHTKNFTLRQISHFSLVIASNAKFALFLNIHIDITLRNGDIGQHFGFAQMLKGYFREGPVRTETRSVSSTQMRFAACSNLEASSRFFSDSANMDTSYEVSR